MARAHKGATSKQTPRDQNIKHNLGVLDIPELNEAEARLPRWEWSPEEDAIIRRYYKKGMVPAIAAYLKKHYPPGRGTDAIRRRARALGVHNRS